MVLDSVIIFKCRIVFCCGNFEVWEDGDLYEIGNESVNEQLYIDFCIDCLEVEMIKEKLK